jgi:hypothetical protein
MSDAVIRIGGNTVPVKLRGGAGPRGFNGPDLVELAAPGGAAEIGYDEGTVADFLGSIIRLGEDIVVTGDATLGMDAFGRIHHVTATATITLPNPGSSLDGGVIPFRPADACTGLVTLSGSFAYGDSEIILWAGEQIELEWYASGGFYRVRTYRKRLMGGRISCESGNIALADNVYSNIILDTPSNDRGAVELGIASTPFYFDVGAGRVRFPRPGQWRVAAFFSVNPTALVMATLTLPRNGATQDTDAMDERQLASGVRQTLKCELEGYFGTAGDYVIPRIRVAGGTGTVDMAVVGYVTVTEVK